MVFTRLLISVLFAVVMATNPASAQADEILTLNNPISDDIAPSWLPSVRDIPIELLSKPAAPEPTDLWLRIRKNFDMPPLKSRLIKKHEKWYARNPEYVLRMSDRARRYLFYIVEEVERRGMPSEIALLPIIESAFRPGANSSAGASGIWQFIPSTGKYFGLEQNWWYDGRRDIVSATNSALDYLQKLHDQFGDWQLALAAYNWGENAVARSQSKNRRRGKPTNYSSLKMPRETRNYVPKLMAVKNIINNPENFGLVLTKISDEPYFEVVATSQHIDVKIAAELADISIEEFNALNPAHNRPIMLQDTSNIVLLPVDKVATFRDNLNKTDQRLVTWQPYKSKKGEMFSRIAQRFGLTVTELRSLNGLSKYARESNGQTLLVPVVDENSAVEFTAFNMHPSAVSEMYGAIRYTVRKGDTISGIAHRFKVSQRQLIEANNGRTFLRIGKRFNIVLADRYTKRKRRAARSKSSIRKVNSAQSTYSNIRKDI